MNIKANFFYNNLINIIFNYIYVNYIYKIILIYVLFFLNTFINFKSILFDRYIYIYTRKI